MRDIIGEMGWGMMGGGYAGRTTSPKSARPGCRFLDQPPPSTKNGKQERQTICEPKKNNAYFVFNLLIINYINQYFNIHLYLIGFIIYNR